MAIPEDVKEYVEKQITLMISQTEAYLPFIKVAFPYSKNLADACYNLIVGECSISFCESICYEIKVSFGRRFC